jgi:hypothetical protein
LAKRRPSWERVTFLLSQRDHIIDENPSAFPSGHDIALHQKGQHAFDARLGAGRLAIA